MYFDMYPCVFFHKELIIRAQATSPKSEKKNRGARVVLGGPIRPKVWLQLEVLIYFPRLIQSRRMFTQVTVYRKECFMEIDSWCLRDEASRGLTYKRLNPKCYTQGGLHHQTHAHYGLDRRHHLHYPRYHHPHPSPSSHCITSHHSMVSFFHKLSNCVGLALARLPIGTFPIGNIANVFQVSRAWAKLAMEHLCYICMYNESLYTYTFYISCQSQKHLYCKLLWYIINIYIYISHLCTHVYSYLWYHLSFGLCL